MDVAELARQIEYKVAPDPLIAVQALANTFAFEADEELLLDSGRAREWLRISELVAPSATVTEDEWRQLVDFRAVVRDLIGANLDGDPAGAARRLRALAIQHPVLVQADVGGRLALDLSPAASVDALIAQMIGIGFQAQLSDQWSRLKVCASDECRWAFYDRSRNRGGTWCKMETCGNTIKNRAYRRRKTAAREESPQIG
jgi:predicted RNA-binding Zn ribbon-like protein